MWYDGGMNLEINGHRLTLTKPVGYPYVTVKGSPEALEMVKDTIELAGQADEDNSLIEAKGSLTMREGTAAMWLQFEVLNYL